MRFKHTTKYANPGQPSFTAAQVFGRKLKPYIPDFKTAFDHVCIHTGEAPT